MARKSMGETIAAQIDVTEELPLQEVHVVPNVVTEEAPIKRGSRQLINCLRNERIIVRHIPKVGGMITNPKHILYGGMAENAIKIFTVPRLSSGMFVNVLTDLFNSKALVKSSYAFSYFFS